MEISLYYRDSIIRAEAKAENFYDAIDFVLPKLEKQIIKHHKYTLNNKTFFIF